MVFRTDALVVGGINRLLVELGVTQLVEHVVVRQTHGTHEHVRVDLAGLVHTNVEQVVLICLKLQPGTPVGDDAGVVGAPAVLVHFILEIDTGAAHDLVHDHALSAVDDERAALGHQRQFADEDLLLLDLTGLLVDQAAGHIHL